MPTLGVSNCRCVLLPVAFVSPLACMCPPCLLLLSHLCFCRTTRWRTCAIPFPSPCILLSATEEWSLQVSVQREVGEGEREGEGEGGDIGLGKH